MKPQRKNSTPKTIPQRPGNRGGWHGGPLPPGPIKVPKAPAAWVPVEPKDHTK